MDYPNANPSPSPSPHPNPNPNPSPSPSPNPSPSPSPNPNPNPNHDQAQPWCHKSTSRPHVVLTLAHTTRGLLWLTPRVALSYGLAPFAHAWPIPPA